jgi:hypothetical protein
MPFRFRASIWNQLGTNSIAFVRSQSTNITDLSAEVRS